MSSWEDTDLAPKTAVRYTPRNSTPRATRRVGDRQQALDVRLTNADTIDHGMIVASLGRLIGQGETGAGGRHHDPDKEHRMRGAFRGMPEDRH